MKKSLIILVSILANISLYAQNDICVPYGASVSVDGIVTQNEWGDSDSLFLGSGSPTKVFYKHDSLNLLVAFVGHLQTSNRFPEILVDVDNDKNTVWSPDDWWFHISAQDCDYQGEYGNYDSCDVVRPNWTAAQNMASGPPSPPYNDTIEVEIPFTTLNMDLMSTDTIGITFLLTNTFNSWQHWPSGADRNDPSSWGNAIFNCGTVSNSDQGALNPSSIHLYPNPASDELTITIKNQHFTDQSSIAIYDQSGRIVLAQKIDSPYENEVILDVSSLSKGTYLFSYINGVEQERNWIVIN